MEHTIVRTKTFVSFMSGLQVLSTYSLNFVLAISAAQLHIGGEAWLSTGLKRVPPPFNDLFGAFRLNHIFKTTIAWILVCPLLQTLNLKCKVSCFLLLFFLFFPSLYRSLPFIWTWMSVGFLTHYCFFRTREFGPILCQSRPTEMEPRDLWTLLRHSTSL